MPGPRDPALTPYAIPFGRHVAGRRYRRVVFATFSQGGKTDTLLDIIGQRQDQDPAPILYTGPNKQFLTEQFEPRIMTLLDEAPALSEKVARGKRNKKTLKIIAGVPLRLAHAGSSAALKSDPFGLCLTDEVDELLKNVKGQGDPVTLIDRRGETYADFVHAIVSTPSEGLVETEVDPVSGLEFWKEAEAEDIGSAIWKLWQSGTRHHWAWPCPHCAEFFIPRFSCLNIPKDATPTQARAEAFVECPRCHGVIEDGHKKAMNDRGDYVAPGQLIEPNGTIVGDPPVSDTLSLWASGLCSPFRSFGDRAAAYVEAEQAGDNEKRQAVKNGVFGELWSPVAGDIPDWRAIANRREPYTAGTLPAEAVYLTFGGDVQKNRIVFVVRGWGARASSWLIEHGELWGDTSLIDVWQDLGEKLTQPIDGVLIKLAFIDSGFRPGKKETVPVNRVYEFCRRFRRFVFPTKGSSVRLIRPLVKSTIEVTRQGSGDKYGLELIRLDTDHWKSFVHERLVWPSDQFGAWHIHKDATEDYCRQLVSEARVRGPSGKPVWIERSRNNHYLDAEAMAAAAGFMLNVHHLKPGARRHAERGDAEAAPEADKPAGKKGGRFGKFAERLNT
jgi:phage terminase large subunit GpA-like protein